MINVGFVEARKLYDFDCAVLHDVDLLLEDDRIILHCGQHPVHYACALDRWEYK